VTGCDGVWLLVPELCHYDQGEPPERGQYEIATQGGIVTFRIKWRKGGQDFETSFAAPLDGSSVTGEFPGIDSFLVRQDGAALISEAYAKGEVVARAVRRASGDLLSVMQENADGRGSWVRTWQVYRKA
jgi:hypothetical protein